MQRKQQNYSLTKDFFEPENHLNGKEGHIFGGKIFNAKIIFLRGQILQRMEMHSIELI